MRLLLLDYFDGIEPASFARFASDTSCFDFDAVIWDPSYALNSYHRSYPGVYRGLPSLDEDSSVKVNADIARRRSEFREFLESGRTLVVIVRPPQEFYYDTGSPTYSGTGRNRQKTINVNSNDIWKALPI